MRSSATTTTASNDVCPTGSRSSSVACRWRWSTTRGRERAGAAAAALVPRRRRRRAACQVRRREGIDGQRHDRGRLPRASTASACSTRLADPAPPPAAAHHGLARPRRRPGRRPSHHAPPAPVACRSWPCRPQPPLSGTRTWPTRCRTGGYGSTPTATRCGAATARRRQTSWPRGWRRAPSTSCASPTTAPSTGPSSGRPAAVPGGRRPGGPHPLGRDHRALPHRAHPDGAPPGRGGRGDPGPGRPRLRPAPLRPAAGQPRRGRPDRPLRPWARRRHRGTNAKTSLEHLNRRALEVAAEHDVAVGAGSDAHVPDAFGAAYAEVPDFGRRRAPRRPPRRPHPWPPLGPSAAVAAPDRPVDHRPLTPVDPYRPGDARTPGMAGCALDCPGPAPPPARPPETMTMSATTPPTPTHGGRWPMSIFQAVVLGIVQGLTEFLPISSSGHLRIVPALFDWPDPGASFTAVIQLGTMAAVVLYFWRDLWRIATAWLASLRDPSRRRDLDARLGWYLIIATIPIGIFGLAVRRPDQDRGPRPPPRRQRADRPRPDPLRRRPDRQAAQDDGGPRHPRRRRHRRRPVARPHPRGVPLGCDDHRRPVPRLHPRGRRPVLVPAVRARRGALGPVRAQGHRRRDVTRPRPDPRRHDRLVRGRLRGHRLAAALADEPQHARVRRVPGRPRDPRPPPRRRRHDPRRVRF